MLNRFLFIFCLILVSTFFTACFDDSESSYQEFKSRYNALKTYGDNENCMDKDLKLQNVSRHYLSKESFDSKEEWKLQLQVHLDIANTELDTIQKLVEMNKCYCCISKQFLED